MYIANRGALQPSTGKSDDILHLKQHFKDHVMSNYPFYSHE